VQGMLLALLVLAVSVLSFRNVHHFRSSVKLVPSSSTAEKDLLNSSSCSKESKRPVINGMPCRLSVKYSFGRGLPQPGIQS
jgi:hypothetical protein